MQPLENLASSINYTSNIRNVIFLYIIYHIVHLKIIKLQGLKVHLRYYYQHIAGSS